MLLEKKYCNLLPRIFPYPLYRAGDPGGADMDPDTKSNIEKKRIRIRQNSIFRYNSQKEIIDIFKIDQDMVAEPIGSGFDL